MASAPEAGGSSVSRIIAPYYYDKIRDIASKHSKLSSAAKQIESDLSLPPDAARVFLRVSIADSDDMKLEDDLSGPPKAIAGGSGTNALSKSLIMAQQSRFSEKNVAFDNLIKSVHPFGIIDPERTPPWSTKSCIKYLLWFPIEFPLALSMSVAGWILAGYGWLKLKRTTTVTPKKLEFAESANTNDALISIIISCFNELPNIELCLLYLQKYCHRPELCEIILVDGNSTDGWIESLQNGILNAQSTDSPITIKTTICPFSEHQCSGRGVCQNIGVQKSKGKLLFFVHADTVLFDGYDEYIRSTLSENNRVVIGSFKFTVNRSLLNAPLVGMGCMELFVRIRNDCFWLPYGDQTYFVKKEIFTALLKGFRNDLVAMEDMVLAVQARKLAVETANEIFVSQHLAHCSPRRWQKNGVAKTTMWNQIIIFCWAYLGYTPAQCYKLYYGVDVPPNKNMNMR